MKFPYLVFPFWCVTENQDKDRCKQDSPGNGTLTYITPSLLHLTNQPQLTKGPADAFLEGPQRAHELGGDSHLWAADDTAEVANCPVPPGAHSSVGKFVIRGASEASGGKFHGPKNLLVLTKCSRRS